VTGRYEPITDDGDFSCRVLAIHGYMGIANKWHSAMFKRLGFNGGMVHK
jgi:hypothetical protein